MAYNNKHFKNLHNNYLELIKNIFCKKFIFNYFENKEECLKYIGFEDELQKFGFHFLIHNFIEDIRIKRNYVKLLYDKNLIVGNISYSDNNYSFWNDEYFNLDKNKDIIFRMNLFNIDEIHSRLNKIFFHIILQYIEEERKLTFNSVENNVNSAQYIYTILIVCHIIVVIFAVSIFWIPKIRKMNDEIYKAKNILSIIPLHILSSLPNIKKLLNISSNSDQYSSQF